MGQNPPNALALAGRGHMVPGGMYPQMAAGNSPIGALVAVLVKDQPGLSRFVPLGHVTVTWARTGLE